MMNNTNDPLLSTIQSRPFEFERGFKSWAENTALTIRKRLSLSKYAPLSPYVFADYLNTKIITPLEITTLSSDAVSYLVSSDGSDWSAVTLRIKGRDIIIYNPSHSDRRTSSTLMHELSHILKNHKPAQVFMNETGLAVRNYDALQEAEADWLAATLLLPRDVLVHCHFRNYSADEACRLYGVSTSLYLYRMNKSGVSRQFATRH